jgi:transposase
MRDDQICEAMSRPNRRFASVKTVEQRDIQPAHRIRARLMDQRKAKANQIRGLALECDLIAPKELLHLRRAIVVRENPGHSLLMNSPPDAAIYSPLHVHLKASQQLFAGAVWQRRCRL